MDSRILYSHSLCFLLAAVLFKAIWTAYLAEQPLCFLSKRMTLIANSSLLDRKCILDSNYVHQAALFKAAIGADAVASFI